MTDLVKANVSEMVNSQPQSNLNNDQGDSLPIVDSEDPSNFYLQYTRDQLGIFE